MNPIIATITDDGVVCEKCNELCGPIWHYFRHMATWHPNIKHWTADPVECVIREGIVQMACFGGGDQ